MKLLSTSEFSLRLIGSPFGEEMPRRELIVNGKPTGKSIDGAVHEFKLLGPAPRELSGNAI